MLALPIRFQKLKPTVTQKSIFPGQKRGKMIAPQASLRTKIETNCKTNTLIVSGSAS